VTIAVGAIAAFSGIAALIFETLWFRLAGLAFGGESGPILDFWRGIGELTRRHCAEAAVLLAATEEKDPGASRPVEFRALALCLSGDRPGAETELSSHGRTIEGDNLAPHPFGVPFMILLAAVLLAASPAPETRLALDLKDAPIEGIVGALAEIGGLQVVVDPGVSCKLTLKLTNAAVGTALDAVLRACGLGSEEANGILRVAPVARLADEARAERQLKDAQEASGRKRLALIHLNYARAQDLLPLVKRLLPPGADVTLDARTNLLIITE
jgi:hypothetical protein